MVKMMTKNYFKSTVSTFVLLTAVSTFTPSLAMEEGEGKEESHSYTQRHIPDDLTEILTPLRERQAQQAANNEQEEEVPLSPLLMLPAELTEIILVILTLLTFYRFKLPADFG